jgi:beta-glucosidase
LQSLKDYLGNQSQVSYLKGCELIDEHWPDSEIFPYELTKAEKASIDSATSEASKSDIIFAVVGEDETIVGESKSRTNLDLPGRQNQLLQALKATGKPLVVILINGHPLTINWVQRNADAIFETWFSNPEMGKALAQTLFGEYCPAGRLPVTVPKTVGQIEYNFPFKQASQSDEVEHGTGSIGCAQVNGFLYPLDLD